MKLFCTKERSKQLHDPDREPTNLCNWGKEAWKKFRALTGFEPVTSSYTGAMLYQLSYEQMKPHIGSQVIFVGSIFPMKKIDERINEIILHGGEKQVIAHDPHREPTNLCNWGKEAWKKIHGFNGIRTRDLREYRCVALPTEL